MAGQLVSLLPTILVPPSFCPVWKEHFLGHGVLAGTFMTLRSVPNLPQGLPRCGKLDILDITFTKARQLGQFATAHFWAFKLFHILGIQSPTKSFHSKPCLILVSNAQCPVFSQTCCHCQLVQLQPYNFLPLPDGNGSLRLGWYL